MAEYIERDAVIALAKDICILTKWDTEYHHRLIDPADVRDLPATNVPPALWTDEPISGTEFMTHNKGQSGFEIHFRTDDMSKYEAVQNECRRQIGHEKPAADVRPVVRARWRYKTITVPGGKGQTYAKWCCTACKGKAKERTNFCPNCGAMMVEKEQG